MTRTAKARNASNKTIPSFTYFAFANMIFLLGYFFTLLFVIDLKVTANINFDYLLFLIVAIFLMCIGFIMLFLRFEFK